MKILVITPYFYPHSGGSQEYILELYTQLVKKHTDVEVDVLCYNTDQASKKEKIQGLNIYRVPCFEILPEQFALPNYWELWKLLKFLKKLRGKYDVVNSHTRFFDNSWWTPFLKSYFEAQTILTDHCASHPTHSSKIVSTIAKVVDLLISKHILPRYDQVVCVSQATANFLSDMNRNIQPNIIYGGVHNEKTIQTNNDKLSKIFDDMNKEDIVISFVGRMIKAKGPQTLLNVAKVLTKQQKNIQVIFAGDGPELKQLKKQNDPRIHFLGKLKKQDVHALLSKTDIFVYPSSHHEGFPIALLEAGLHGCAVVTTDQGGIIELIHHNKTGIITKPNKKAVQENVKKLINNAQLRNKLGNNLEKKVEREFSWEKLSKQYYQLLRTWVQ